MNYEPNNIDWKVGDLVIHDADRKTERMLMRVVGIEPNGLTKTEYVSLKGTLRYYFNRKEVLHDPARFGVYTPPTPATTPSANNGIRRTIQSAGDEFFEQMYAANSELGNIAGEFMSLNEQYVLNHRGTNETYATLDILKTGFTKNQKKFLERLKSQLQEENTP